MSTVNDLARQQTSLEGETSLLAEKLALAEVINLALGGAARQMTRAAELLNHRETGGATQSSQEAARLRLEQLLVAFQDKKQSPKGGGKEGAGGSAGGKGTRSDGNQVLTQLKLLKLLQEDLNGRYRTLTAAESDAATVPERELSELAAEQGKLAELTMKLSQPPEDNPEDDPERLPDVRESNPEASQRNLNPQLVPPIDTPPPAEKEPT